VSALLQVQNVTKRFGGLTANHDISFDVQDNEILSVIGPNGAGKSTLFKMISSFLPTTSGQVLFKGGRISNRKPHIAARKGVVRTFQETTIFKSMTVRESVIVAQHLRAKASLAGYFWGTCRKVICAPLVSPLGWRPTPRYCSWTNPSPA
jgi:branched-chain amino acid transport system ATP-binding protein